MTQLFAVGLNHRVAPLELRERLSLSEQERLHRALEGLRHGQGVREVMLLSTCNRVEIYGVAEDWATHSEAALRQLARECAVDAEQVVEHGFFHGTRSAARHIFRVASSLDSLVVGEPQILGQVKDAFSSARELGTVGPILDRCLTTAFKAAKRVRTETEIARGSASVASAAVDLARSIYGDLRGRAVLVVGAGEMAEQAGVHLRAAGAAEIVVVNRSEARGRALAERVEGRYVEWAGLEAQLMRTDIVVTSTGASVPVIQSSDLRRVMKARRHEPLFLVDIAVPRDVEPEAGDLDHVFLYNVDDLQNIVHDNLRARTDEAQRAESLVDEEVTRFLQWQRTRSVGPLIAALHGHAAGIVDGETDKVLGRLDGLTAEQQQAVRQYGRAIAQKLLHRPVTRVRDAVAQADDGAVTADALQALFGLEGPEPGDDAEPSPASAADASDPEPEPSA